MGDVIEREERQQKMNVQMKWKIMNMNESQLAKQFKAAAIEMSNIYGHITTSQLNITIIISH